MSTDSKIIQGLQKQNDSIYSSLVARSIQFDRSVIPEDITITITDEELIKLLNDENNRLKEVVKVNKPAPQPKEEKKKQELVPKQESKPKTNDDMEQDDEEIFEEPVKKFDIITNMEEIKRAFFSVTDSNYSTFEELAQSHPFKFYKMNYKYNSDKDGAPDFSAKNLLKGIVRNFDDYRKYFMICFRCWKDQNESIYKYDSFWIVNTNDPIQNIIGSIWDDFEQDLSFDLENKFLESIRKLPEIDEPVYIDGYTCIGESYVH